MSTCLGVALRSSRLGTKGQLHVHVCARFLSLRRAPKRLFAGCKSSVVLSKGVVCGFWGLHAAQVSVLGCWGQQPPTDKESHQICRQGACYTSPCCSMLVSAVAVVAPATHVWLAPYCHPVLHTGKGGLSDMLPRWLLVAQKPQVARACGESWCVSLACLSCMFVLQRLL